MFKNPYLRDVKVIFWQLWDVYVAELLCIGNLVAAAYLRAESESNIHVEGSPKSGGEISPKSGGEKKR